MKTTINKSQTETRKYYIDYIYDNTTGPNYYHQLVRDKDGAILYANEKLDNIFLHCFHAGISKDDIVIL